MDFQTALPTCEQLITQGSKSFSLAARVFPKETRQAAFALYSWCRHCDDVIDESILGMKTTPSNPSDRGVKDKLLKDLVEKTKLAYTDYVFSDPIFFSFQYVVKKYHIPIEYPLDLLEGMKMDISHQEYKTISDLEKYCYCVAGTVGLMMSHIMGLSDEKALKNACDMGIAMQLTNIARDIREDFEMNRIYVPLDWLKKENIPAEKLLDLEQRAKLVTIAKNLVNEAESFYESGDNGLNSLSFQAACAVSSAREVYSQIGKQVVQKGPQAFQERTIVSLPVKIFVMLKGIFKIFSSLPKRIFHPWKRVSINKMWRMT
ncbi:MAG: phytoene/squalene synthase family protein [Elusimicrobiota bacterium]